MLHGLLRAPRLVILVACLAGPLGWLAFQLPRAATVEAVYTQGAYPVLVGAIAALSGRARFAVVEPGALLGLALVLRWVWAARQRGQGWAWVAGRLLGLASVGYAVFLVVWGGNYRRETLAVTLGLEVRPSSVAELQALGQALRVRADTLRVGQAEDGAGTFDVPGGVDEVFRRCEVAYATQPALVPFPRVTLSPPKPLLVSPVLSWMGLLGFYSPPTAEPNVNVEAPIVSLPFTTLHEMAHARGVANEDEASYLAYRLSKSGADRILAYSAAWNGLRYVLAALGRVDRDAAVEIWRSASPGVRRDSDAWAAWMEAHESPLRGMADTVNDTYLRSQGVADGVHSYGRVVDLLLADARADAASTPAVTPLAP